MLVTAKANTRDSVPLILRAGTERGYPNARDCYSFLGSFISHNTLVAISLLM